MPVIIKGKFVNLSKKELPEAGPKAGPKEKVQNKTEELAQKNDFLEVNGYKKNWTKSDYLKDMLDKE
jgi:hypothetical protein